MRPPHTLVRHVIPRNRYTSLSQIEWLMLLVPGIVAFEGFKVALGGRLGFLRVIIRGSVG
jgi:hypothetical protein